MQRDPDAAETCINNALVGQSQNVGSQGSISNSVHLNVFLRVLIFLCCQRIYQRHRCVQAVLCTSLLVSAMMAMCLPHPYHQRAAQITELPWRNARALSRLLMGQETPLSRCRLAQATLLEIVFAVDQHMKMQVHNEACDRACCIWWVHATLVRQLQT